MDSRISAEFANQKDLELFLFSEIGKFLELCEHTYTLIKPSTFSICPQFAGEGRRKRND